MVPWSEDETTSSQDCKGSEIRIRTVLHLK